LFIAVLYGWHSDYMIYAPVVRICAVAVGFVYLGIAASAYLNGIHRTRQAFFGQVVYAACYVLIVMPLTAKFGMYGAAWGWLIATVSAGATYAYNVSRTEDQPREINPIPIEAEMETVPIQ
jgi:O-antigen/teichoic acid export membrane protein